MKAKPAPRIAALICALIIATVWAAQGLGRLWPRFDLFTRLEWMAYDWRVRLAARHAPPASPRLGFVYLDDDSIEAVGDGWFGRLPYRFGLYWPRQVYGRLVNELAAQGATAIGLDILFGERRPDHPPATLPDESQVGSDEFFAAQMREAGNVILAADRGLPPHELFRTNAGAVADISAQREADGILRRAKAFEDVFLWHPLLRSAAREWGGDLREARVEAGRIVVPLTGGGERSVPLPQGSEFDQAALYEELAEKPAPAGAPRYSPAFTRLRCWHMGIALAARALNLDLEKAEVALEKGRIVLSGPAEARRVIPVDRKGRFYIDWSMTPYHPALTKESIESLLFQYEQRRGGQAGPVTNRWKDKLVVVGSTATGNDLTDLGGTPLEKETYLLSQQWNVANSVLTERFVRAPSLALEWALALGLGLAAGLMTWHWRVLRASAGVLGAGLLYLGVAAWVYVQWRWWLPVVLPVGGAMLVLHAGLVTFQVVHEQRERRRIAAIFGRVVSPSIRDELLEARQLSLGGVRREITVLFADLRGFTQMTDASQTAAQEQVAQRHLDGPTAQTYLERRSQEVLSTVNLYLGLIADQVKRHDGTLDKYIGDCVMAFWGAPTPTSRPAARCVRAMIEAQKTLHFLNQQRADENQHRAAAPDGTAEAAPDDAAPLPLLSLGVGINTGPATVGLIGSEEHIFNYTVVGREVNLAYRLQEIAGPGSLLLSESTFQALQRDDPPLAALCEEQPPATLKGLRQPVRFYAVRWQDAPITASF